MHGGTEKTRSTSACILSGWHPTVMALNYEIDLTSTVHPLKVVQQFRLMSSLLQIYCLVCLWKSCESCSIYAVFTAFKTTVYVCVVQLSMLLLQYR